MKLSILPDLKAKLELLIETAHTRYQDSYADFRKDPARTEALNSSYYELGRKQAFQEIYKALKPLV